MSVTSMVHHAERLGRELAGDRLSERDDDEPRRGDRDEGEGVPGEVTESAGYRCEDGVRRASVHVEICARSSGTSRSVFDRRRKCWT